MNKGELMKLTLTESERNYCDSAIPMHLWEKCTTSVCVYDCRNNVIINLAERLISGGQLQSILDDLQEAKYLLKGMRKKYGTAESDFDLAMISIDIKKEDS